MANVNPTPFSREATQLAVRNRLAYSRNWYRKQLISVATGQSTMTPMQFRALVEYGRLMGWYANARVKRRTQPQTKRPCITDDVLARMTLPVSEDSAN
jgi:hypothetical protein